MATVEQSVAARTFASLAIPDFRNLWFGNVLVFMATSIRMVASGYLAYDLTSSPIVLGVVNAGYAIPMLLMTPVGGALADRYDRRRLVQGAQLAFSATAGAIAFTILTGTVAWWHLLVASAMQGAIWTSLVPARQALVPQIVGKPLMTNGLALMASAFSASMLIGPAVGGAIYAWAGPGAAYLSVAVFGLMAVALTGRVNPQSSATPDEAKPSMLAGTLEAI